MSESTTKRRHRQPFHAGANDLPVGVNYRDFNELGRRAGEWLEWKAGKRAEPEWYKPAQRRVA